MKDVEKLETARFEVTFRIDTYFVQHINFFIAT